LNQQREHQDHITNHK